MAGWYAGWYWYGAGAEAGMDWYALGVGTATTVVLLLIRRLLLLRTMNLLRRARQKQARMHAMRIRRGSVT